MTLWGAVIRKGEVPTRMASSNAELGVWNRNKRHTMSVSHQHHEDT